VKVITEEVKVALNTTLGITQEVADKMEKVIEQLVEVGAKCGQGYAVLYGGFHNGRLQEEWFDVEYHKSINKMYLNHNGDYYLPLIALPCFVSELVYSDMEDREYELVLKVEQVIQRFNEVYHTMTVEQVCDKKRDLVIA
jgi:hypothetical protein